MKSKKISRQLLEQQFPAEYIKQGLNGTKAYKAIKPNVSSDQVAKVQASRLLTNDNVMKSIIDLLPSDEEETRIIKEAYKAKKPDYIDWSDLHKYVALSLKLKGKLDNANTNSVNIGIIIKDK